MNPAGSTTSGVPTVDCIYIDKDTSGPVIVPVPVHRGFDHRCCPCDLYTNLYVATHDLTRSNVTEMVFTHTAFPVEVQGVAFIGYVATQHVNASRRPLNKFFKDTFSCNVIFGDILLIKADFSGRTIDVQTTEIQLIIEVFVAKVDFEFTQSQARGADVFKSKE
ncbi:hypothetical protein BKA70DRAFT_1232470 [Coprinopsis sp. MPI-PUGE-AT-0042]|nr:hypothetical protein BKA70DRAFT_1232470 [Coprinopsis sp. MPI-PUGE-AT-0042]